MKNMLIIAVETYKQKVESKVFIIMLLLLATGTFFGMNYKAIFKGNEAKKETVLVVSKDQQLLSYLKKERADVTIAFVNGGSTIATAKKELKEAGSKTILTLDKDQNGLFYGKVYYQGALLHNVTEQLQLLTTELNQSIKLQQLNINEEQQRFLNEQTILRLESLEGNQDDSVKTLILVYIVGFILYIAVMLFSTMVAQDIAVEKSSRVMEILLTTITPVQHLVGKIVGIGLLGITQGASITISAYASYKLFGDSTGVFAFFKEGKNTQGIFLAAVCFILGYLIYSMVAAILGSLVSSVQEVQQLMYVVIIPLFIALFMVVIMATGSGSNPIIRASSYVPFLSPIVMYARYMLGDATMTKFSIAMGINVGFTIILALLGKSVYQGGVFIYSGDKITNVLKKAFQSGKYYT